MASKPLEGQIAGRRLITWFIQSIHIHNFYLTSSIYVPLDLFPLNFYGSRVFERPLITNQRKIMVAR